MTQSIWKPANLGTLTQQLLESVGLNLAGQAILQWIKLEQRHPITDTIHIDLCVRSSDMAPIMEVSLQLSQPKPNSPSPSSSSFSQSISKLFRRTSDGKLTLTMSYAEWASLRHLLDGLDISGEDATTIAHFEKLLRTIRNALLQISSTVPC